MLQRQNPYLIEKFIDAMLVDESRFIGSRDDLEVLLARVSDVTPAAVSLVGAGGMGKSFLLQILAHKDGARRLVPYAVGSPFRAEPERLLFVMVDCLEFRSERENQPFSQLLYRRLIAELSASFEVDDFECVPIDGLIDNAELDHLPLTGLRKVIQQATQGVLLEHSERELRERFKATLRLSDDEDYLPKEHQYLPGLLTGLVQLLKDWRLRVIFLLDNFDSVISPAIEREGELRPFDRSEGSRVAEARYLKNEDLDYLRDLVSYASLVVATRRVLSELISDHDARRSPFFNLLQQLKPLSLLFLSPRETQRLIIEPPSWLEQPDGFRFSERDAIFIQELVGRHPNMILTACEYLYRWHKQRAEPRQGDIIAPQEQGYVRALLRPIFANYFAHLWTSLEPSEQLTLNRITLGETVDDSSDAMVYLINNGYLLFEGSRYQLFCKLFQDYVRSRSGELAAAPATRQSTTPAREAGAEPSALESRLIALFESQLGELIAYNDITLELYNEPYEVARGKLEVLISRIRRKFNDRYLLVNVRGQGYRLVPSA